MAEIMLKAQKYMNAEDALAAIREKTDRNLDGMVRRTNSPFTMKVLECPMPSKFRFP